MTLHAQARWWASVLDWHVTENDDEAAIVPKDVRSMPRSLEEWQSLHAGLVFVRVPESKTVKNRLHIDLAPFISDDRNALIDELLAAGASRADVGQDDSDVDWTVLADPEGNEICVLSARGG